MPERVLHLGTDRYFLQACLRHDVEAIAVCGTAAWDVGVRMPPGVEILHVDSHQSLECVLGAVTRAGMDDGRFDAVQTTDEWSLVTAGAVAAILGCRGIDPRTALLFRDKALQKSRVRDAGLPAARHRTIPDVREMTADDGVAAGPMVLKPVAGAGTGMTRTIEGPDQLPAAAAAHRGRSTPHRTFLLEEFQQGEEWYADGVVFDGEVLFYALGAYGEPCLVSVDEQLPISTRRLDPDTDREAYERADRVVPAALEALGLRAGVFHMELFHDPAIGGVVFSECAARRGGILIQEEVLYKFGVDLAECALLCTLGRRPQLSVQVRPAVVGGAFLSMRPGVVVHSPAAAELAELPGVVFARMDRPEGALLPERLTDATQRMGQVLVSAADPGELAERIAFVRRWYDDRLLVAPANGTMRELRSWHAMHWPNSDFGYTLYEA